MDGGGDTSEADLVSHGQRDFGNHVTGVFGDDGGTHDLICPLADVHPDHAIGFTIEQGSIPMVQGQIIYDLPVDTIDLLEQTVRTQTGAQQTDINITRISVDTYATIPNKNAQGRPIQVWINRQSGATYPVGGRPDGTDPTTGVDSPKINVWPCPDQNNYYTFVYWRMRRIQDAGTGGVTTQDIPFRFLPCMVAGLAYYLSLKIPGGLERSGMLKVMYDEQFQLAADEDREKASLRLAPRQYFR